MKQLFVLIALVCLSHVATAQLIQKEDGKYYNTNEELYSGTYIEYYASGDKRIEMNLLLGLKHGQTIIYFEKQIVNEIRSFKNNIMDGTWLTFNAKSIKIGEANYANGLKHGKWYIWDDNGVKRYEMEYNSGVKVGTWRIWDEKGTLVEEKNYLPK